MQPTFYNLPDNPDTPFATPPAHGSMQTTARKPTHFAVASPSARAELGAAADPPAPPSTPKQAPPVSQPPGASRPVHTVAAGRSGFRGAMPASTGPDLKKYMDKKLQSARKPAFWPRAWPVGRDGCHRTRRASWVAGVVGIWQGWAGAPSGSERAAPACAAVKLNGNRNIEGTLRGFDQFMNLVIDDTEEKVSASESNKIGMVVVRGNSIVMMEALEKLWDQVPVPSR